MAKTRTRVRRSTQQWRRILDELETSGLDRKTFCERKGLRREALRRAERRLAAGREAPAPLSFVELAAPLPEAEPSRGWDVELELGDGLVLRLARR